MSRRGFTLIELMIVIAIIAIIAAILVPNLIEARKGGNESAAIGALRTIATAQQLFRESDKDGNGVMDYAPTLQALFDNGRLIDEGLASGVKQGYRFTLVPVPPESTRFIWAATARPVTPGESGDRAFFVDESGVIRFSETPAASVGDPPIGG